LGPLFLGERIGPRDFVGLALITAGIFLVQRS
jgi:drug/metabolite transporter (DMT)-like permease